MKKILFSCICLLTIVFSEAQDKKTVSGKSKAIQNLRSLTTTPVHLNSASSYTAKANQNLNVKYQITDPTIIALNEKARGYDVPISKSGIVGMPKRAYGFANGHIILQTTGSTSSGTETGSGVVGTGSSLGSMGTNGPAMEVNGKSPYAGISMWGNARGLWIRGGDSSVRRF
ncbi:MAG: hypothetical protein ACJ75B_07320 [Flavisolibacter sp.]